MRAILFFEKVEQLKWVMAIQDKCRLRKLIS